MSRAHKTYWREGIKLTTPLSAALKTPLFLLSSRLLPFPPFSLEKKGQEERVGLPLLAAKRRSSLVGQPTNRCVPLPCKQAFLLSLPPLLGNMEEKKEAFSFLLPARNQGHIGFLSSSSFASLKNTKGEEEGRKKERKRPLLVPGGFCGACPNTCSISPPLHSINVDVSSE